jgi:hypothetical protein
MPSKNQNAIFTVMILLCFFIGLFAFVKLKRAVEWKLITNRAFELAAQFQFSIHLIGEKSVCLFGYLIIGEREVHLSKLISLNQVKN